MEKIQYFVIVAILFLLQSSMVFAHTTELRAKINNDNSATFYARTYHTINVPTGGFKIDGVTYPFTSIISSSSLPAGTQLISQCNTTFNSSDVYQAVTVPAFNPCVNHTFDCTSSAVETPLCPLSNSLTLGAPVVNAQPSVAGGGGTICSGGNISISMTASGTNLTYQWQINTGGGFVDVVNNATYGGATTNTLTITSTTGAMNGHQFRNIVTGSSSSCGSQSTTSNAVTLSIIGAPAITAQPVDRTLCGGTNTTFSVTATGGGLTYKWQLNTGSGFTTISDGGIYTGATTATLTITGATAGMNGYQYRVVVSGSCTPSVTSNVVTLTTGTSPAITAQPSGTSACAGTNASFTVAASGSALTYQWQESQNGGGTFNTISNGGVYAGATSAVLSITGATVGMNNYQYRVIVSGTCTPTVTSSAVILNVNAVPAITVQPSNSTLCATNNATFSVTATGAGIVYQWQENTGSGFTNITNGGVYSGATTTALTITGATSGMNTYQYRVVVSGTCSPSATSNAATLTVNTPPSITTNPSAKTVIETGTTSFTTVAVGSGLTYQWQESQNGGALFNNITNGVIYTGTTTATLTITGATLAMDGYQYRVIVSGTCAPSATTSAATLTVLACQNITVHPSNSTICPGGNTSFTITAGGAVTGYQWQESQNGGTTFNNLANGLIFSDVTTSSLTVTGATAAMNGYQYRCIVSGACAPAVNSSSAILTVTTAPIVTAHPSSTSICPSGTAFFTVAASGTSVTYRWQESTGGAFTNVTNGGVYGGSTTATLTITGAPIAMNTYQYRCVVTDVCTQTSTSNNATLTVNATPAITTQPVNSTLCGGNNTTFSVVVTGSGLTYQWQVNQGNGFTNLVTNGVYTGATTATLTITGATEGMNGYTYRCVTTGTCDPSVTSNTVTLTVNVAPTITAHPSSTTICTGENSSHAITATGTALTYQWQESTGGAFTNITNGGVYGGATSSTLTLTGATTGMNNYQYRCVVSGTCTPSVTSNVATLAVNAAPVLTQHPANSSICINGNATITILTTGTVASYQWQESQNGGTTFSDLTNGGVYGGVTTASLIITGAPSAMNDYRYRCVVAGGSGTCATTLTSNAATLSVGADPVITSQPTNTSAAPNTSATFIVSTAGVGITYQWQEQRINGGFLNIANGGIYSGVTTAVLTINPVASGMHNYQYRCIVTNSCGISANSNAAILTVPTSGGGANITGQPSDKDVCEGSSATFSVTVENGASYSYQWQEIINDSVYKWITDGGIYSGAATTTLRIANTTTSMNNNKYRCDVGGSFSEKAKLAVSTAPAITAQPANTTVCSGSPTSFSIAAAGSGLAYQWQESQDGGASFHNVTNGGIFSGTALTTLNISNVPSWMSNWRYRSIASQSSCSSVSTSAVVTVYTMPDTGVTVFGQNLFSKASSCTYQWLDCTNSFSPLAGQTNKSFVAMQSGSYAVELTKNGCKDTSACYSIIVAGVADENAHRSHISLYPNPTRGSIMVDAGETITAISVTNALGQTIFSTRVALPEPIEVSLHDAPPGIYFFRIETRTGEHFEHVVKQ